MTRLVCNIFGHRWIHSTRVVDVGVGCQGEQLMTQCRRQCGRCGQTGAWQ